MALLTEFEAFRETTRLAVGATVASGVMQGKEKYILSTDADCHVKIGFNGASVADTDAEDFYLPADSMVGVKTLASGLCIGVIRDGSSSGYLFYTRVE